MTTNNPPVEQTEAEKLAEQFHIGDGLIGGELCDLVIAFESLTAPAAVDVSDIAQPTEKGSFHGDCFFGDPTDNLKATHRWVAYWERV